MGSIEFQQLELINFYILKTKTVNNIAKIIFCAVLVVASVGVITSFVVPQTADAVVDLGCVSCGGDTGRGSYGGSLEEWNSVSKG